MAKVKSGLFHCLEAGYHGKVGVAVHMPRLLVFEVISGVEALHFSSNPGLKGLRVKQANAVHTRLAADKGFPQRGDI